MSLQNVTQKQIELAKEIFGPGTEYVRLLKAYELWHKVGMVQKHHTHDSVFFIVDEGAVGFKTISFYNDGVDIRVSGYFETIGEAFTAVMVNYEP